MRLSLLIPPVHLFSFGTHIPSCLLSCTFFFRFYLFWIHGKADILFDIAPQRTAFSSIINPFGFGGFSFCLVLYVFELLLRLIKEQRKQIFFMLFWWLIVYCKWISTSSGIRSREIYCLNFTLAVVRLNLDPNS